MSPGAAKMLWQRVGQPRSAKSQTQTGCARLGVTKLLGAVLKMSYKVSFTSQLVVCMYCMCDTMRKPVVRAIM